VVERDEKYMASFDEMVPEFIEKMARTGPGELRYLGMALLGPRHQVDRLTGSLPLLR
jgi:hypothetical protein